VTRGPVRSNRLLAEVDGAAFGSAWRLDSTMLDDVRTATPASRQRVVTTESW
jgi:hypothetical protein